MESVRFVDNGCRRNCGSDERIRRLGAVVGAVALVFAVGSTGRADLRKPAAAAVAATVSVQWEYGGSEDERRPDAVRLSSGTAVSADGLIVTTSGPAPAKGRYRVTLGDGRTVPADLVVEDQRSELLLLEADANELAFLQPAEGTAQIGQEVLAASCIDPGNRRVRRGIVSATDRLAEAIEAGGLPVGLVEIDAAVGEMGAGAPIVDADGRLLAVATLRPRTALAETTLAVPAEYVQFLLDAHRKRQGERITIHRGLLGVSLSKPDDERFARVSGVIPKSPAAEGGILEGDAIVAVDGRPTLTDRDVLAGIGRHTDGDKVTLTIERDGKRQPIEVVLGRRELPRDPLPELETTRVERVQPNGVWLDFFDPNATPAPGYNATPAPQYRVLVPQAGPLPSEGAKPGGEAVPNSQDLRWSIEPPQRSQAAPGNQTERPAVRVFRSDTDQKIDELTAEVKSLREEITELAEQMRKLQGRLTDEPPDGN